MDQFLAALPPSDALIQSVSDYNMQLVACVTLHPTHGYSSHGHLAQICLCAAAVDCRLHHRLHRHHGQRCSSILDNMHQEAPAVGERPTDRPRKHQGSGRQARAAAERTAAQYGLEEAGARCAGTAAIICRLWSLSEGFTLKHAQSTLACSPIAWLPPTQAATVAVHSW